MKGGRPRDCPPPAGENCPGVRAHRRRARHFRSEVRHGSQWLFRGYRAPAAFTHHGRRKIGNRAIDVGHSQLTRQSPRVVIAIVVVTRVSGLGVCTLPHPAGAARVSAVCTETELRFGCHVVFSSCDPFGKGVYLIRTNVRTIWRPVPLPSRSSPGANPPA